MPKSSQVLSKGAIRTDADQAGFVSGCRWTRSGIDQSAAHSGLMFAALMIGHHFSISAFCSAPSAAGVC
jgi:hypothetical protein